MSVLSLEGFEAFASRLVLDNGRRMELAGFQRQMVADWCAPGVRETWCVLPEASGKSTLTAAFALCALMLIPNANVVICSVTQAQAGSAMFRQASDFIARTPGLDRHLRAVDGRLRIYGPRKSRLDVKPSVPSSAQGSIPNVVIVDELGELPTMDLARVMRGKLGKREGARMIIVSSAGEPGGEFELALEAMRNTAEEVHRDGRHTRYRSGAAVVHEWRLAAGDRLTDWATLALANPLQSPDALREKFESPLTTEAHFRRYTAGIPERGDDHVIGRDAWNAARGEIPQESPARVVLGIDFAQKWDAWAAVPAALYPDGTVHLGPATLLEPPKPGQPIPLAEMQATLARLHAVEKFDEVWMNPAAGSTPLEDWCDQHIAPVTVYGQQQPEALELTETFVNALHTGKLRHSGDDVLTQHVLNATARFTWDGSRFVFTRPAASRTAKQQATRRIDALSAATLAVLGALHDPPPEPFFYWLDEPTPAAPTAPATPTGLRPRPPTQQPFGFGY